MTFKYHDNDPEVSRRHAESKGDWDRPINDKFKVYTPKEGKNRIRIMPRTWKDEDGPRHWAFALFLHYDVGPDNGRYPCPQRMKWGPCPICEERARLADSDKEAADSLRPNVTQLVWVIDRNEEEEGPQVFMMPTKKLEGPICDLSRNEETGATLKIDHPESGHDVTFTRGGKGRNTDYTAAKVLPTPSFLAEDEKDEKEWLEFIEANPIPTVINRYDYAYLEKVFSGGSSRKNADDEQEEPAGDPPRSRRQAEAESESDEPPPRSGRRRSEAPAEEQQEAPARRARTESDPDADIDEPQPERRRRSAPPVEDPPARGELREEIKQGLRRRRRSEDEA